MKEISIYLLVAFLALTIVLSWALPLLLKYGFWKHLSFTELSNIYGHSFPEVIEWVNKRINYIPPIKDLWKKTTIHIGYVTCFFSILGLIAIFAQKKTIERWFLLIWAFSIFPMVYLSITSRPVRLFEYFYFSLILISGIGLSFWFQKLSEFIKVNKILIPYKLIILLSCFYIHFGYLTFKYKLTFREFHEMHASYGKKEHVNHVQRLYNRFLISKNSEDGLTKRWGLLYGFLVTLNPDFWEIFAKLKKPHIFGKYESPSEKY